jgi:hypothetical protein
MARVVSLAFFSSTFSPVPLRFNHLHLESGIALSHVQRDMLDNPSMSTGRR